MEERLKERLVGAIVLVSLAVVFVPIVFDMPRDPSEDISTIPITEIPERPRDGFGSTTTMTLDVPQTPRLDTEVEDDRDRDTSSANPDARDASSGALAAARTSAASGSSVSGSTSASSAAAAPASDASESPAPESQPEPSPAGSGSGATANAPDDAPKQTVKAPAAGDWIVQIGSFQKSENANALRKRLLARGYPAFVESGPSAQGSVSRVFVGPMRERKQAEDTAAKLWREMEHRGIVRAYPDD